MRWPSRSRRKVDVRALALAIFDMPPLPPLDVAPLPPGAVAPALTDAQVRALVGAVPELNVAALFQPVLEAVVAALPEAARERARRDPATFDAVRAVVLSRVAEWRESVRARQYENLGGLFPRPEVSDA